MLPRINEMEQNMNMRISRTSSTRCTITPSSRSQHDHNLPQCKRVRDYKV